MGSNELFIIASLSNQPFGQGYVVQSDANRLPQGGWQEMFNSDAAI